MRRSQIAIILFFTFLAKLFLALKIPIFGDESYYWFWGQHIQLSYFDHPGMVGWLTWLGSQLQFFSSALPYALSVRWPFVLISTLSLFLFFKILNFTNKSNPKFIFWLIVFYLLNPMLGVGGILATPDVPLVFFWTLSYWLVLLIIENQKSKNYFLLGASLGLGLCSKYHIVLFPVSVLMGLLISKKISLIQPKKIMLTILGGILFSMPVLIWNYQHNWASFAFQLNHGFQGKSYTPLWTITYILGQIFLFNPFLFFKFMQSSKNLFSKNSALTQWIFFLISSFRAGVEANWPVTAHVQGLSSIDATEKNKFLKSALIYSVFIWFLFFIFLSSDLGREKLNKIPSSAIAEKLWPQISMYQPLYGPTYQMSSLLQLVSGQKIIKLNELSRFDFYDSGLFERPTEKIFYTLKYDISDWPHWLDRAQKKPIKIFSEYNLGLYRVEYE